MRMTWRLGLFIPALATPLWIFAAPAVAGASTATSTAAPALAPVETLPGGTVGDYYQAALEPGATNETWTLVSGDPPAGLMLTPEGILEGTPTAAGTDTFTAKEEKTALAAKKKTAGGCGCKSIHRFTITITGASPAQSMTPRPSPPGLRSAPPSPSVPPSPPGLRSAPPSPSVTPSVSRSGSPAPSSTRGPGPAQSAPPSSGGKAPTLPVTGASLGTTVGIGALLIIVGLVLATAGVRYRRSR